MRPSLVVDSSALLAILLGEEDRNYYVDQLTQSAKRYLSAANWLEASICVDAAGQPPLAYQFDALVRQAAICIVPVSVEQATLARDAYRIFGKGNGHPAKLNFGDCFSYALAKTQNDPLLFKGNDFLHTDLELITQALP